MERKSIYLIITSSKNKKYVIIKNRWEELIYPLILNTDSVFRWKTE